MGSQGQHNWPTNDEHVWTPWMLKTKLPKATQYRMCVHPECKAVETREVPKA